MIPKIIHYCWLSNDPFPPEIQKCIDSWKKYMPDYKIKRWSTENFDINSILLVKEAYEAKKYAFAADYIRCYALYTEGGIYLDSDVLLHNSLVPLLDGFRYVTAIEYHPAGKNYMKRLVNEDGSRKESVEYVPGVGLQAAVMASEPEHSFLKKCIDFYNEKSLNYILNRKLYAPVVQSLQAEDYGFRYVTGLQNLNEDMVVYPNTFIGQHRLQTKGRFCTHMCEGSWVSRETIHDKIRHYSNKVGIYGIYMKIKDFLKLT